ncbi:hypothetical protein ABFS82_11G013800 [Erythranthe guttata]
MEKMASLNPTSATKHTKKKKKKKRQPPPLKIVYITNPIKFKTSASQFRALVQQLTGQYAADTPPPEPNSFPADDGGGGGEAADDAVKVADENDIHVAVDDDEVTMTTTTSENYILGHPANTDAVHKYGSESDPSIIGLYNDVFFLSTDDTYFSWINGFKPS